MQVVGPEVPPVQELIGAKRPTLSHQLPSGLLHQLKISTRHLSRNRIGQLIHQDDFGSQRHHHARPLPRVALGHDRHEGIALEAADDGQAGPRVPAGEFDHRLTRADLAAGFGIFDDLPRDPVLLGKTRIEVVQLGQDPAIDIAGDPQQLDQGRLADGLYGRRQQEPVSSHFTPESGSLLPTVGIANLDHAGENLIPGSGIGHDRVGEHAAVPADVPAGSSDFTPGVAKPVPAARTMSSFPPGSEAGSGVPSCRGTRSP